MNLNFENSELKVDFSKNKKLFNIHGSYQVNNNPIQKFSLDQIFSLIKNNLHLKVVLMVK